ncbi:hypothetical protein F4821DRAFT_236336 [Hypoxylon rubiginosum]|uniref:Uncharacterized protein n=1 Tax=Hypoxylon rubiginosum TaxID=110542 RepID=A0ACC0D3Q5_9PEZI|nr:hypothetical protein F4821DRAFT_236336 [Hypoxylon rubiginosum]
MTLHESVVRTMMLLLITLLIGIIPATWSRAVTPLSESLAVSSAFLDADLDLGQNFTARHSQLRKRDPSQQAITKGRRLDCLMSATVDHATQINGGVRVEENFDEWLILISDDGGDDDEGWRQQEINPKYQSSGIQANLAALTGANPDDTSYLYYSSQEMGTVDGNPAYPSRAYWGNGINPQGGVIIADWNLSPRYALEGLPIASISRIRQWSQAAWGEWEYWANAVLDNSGNLRYVIRSWVTNTATQDQIIEALRAVGNDKFPGVRDRVTFSRNSEDPAEANAFYALLGTPNGASTGYLLASHKGKIGIKRVGSISVWNHPFGGLSLFTDRRDLKINMLFTFEGVTNPTTGEPEGS